MHVLCVADMHVLCVADIHCVLCADCVCCVLTVCASNDTQKKYYDEDDKNAEKERLLQSGTVDTHTTQAAKIVRTPVRKPKRKKRPLTNDSSVDHQW